MNPRANDLNTKENRGFVCVGLSLLAQEYLKQATKADALGDEHTKSFCHRRATFLVLELRTKYADLDFSDKLHEKLKKKLQKKITPETDPRQRKLDLSAPADPKPTRRKRKATKRRKR